MKKRHITLLIISSIFLILIVSAAINKQTSKWESSDRIISSQGNLQDLTSTDLFRVNKNSILDSTKPNLGHNLSEIWVSINGNEMSFKEAVETTNLCAISRFITTTYSNAPDPSHLGTEVEITTPYDNQVKSLQDAINDGSLVNIDGGWTSWTSWSSCSKACGGGTQSRSRTCKNPEPFCNGNNCAGNPTQTRSCNTQACPDVYGNWVVQSHDFSSGNRPKCEGGFPGCCASAVRTAGARDRCNGDTDNQYTCSSSANHGACDDIDFRSSCITNGNNKIIRVSWWYRTVACNA